jgi:hypothetical protein
VATEQVVRVGGPEPSLTVMAGRGKQTWLVVGSAAFVAVGTWMIVTGDLLLIVLGVVCVVVFALFGVSGRRRALHLPQPVPSPARRKAVAWSMAARVARVSLSALSSMKSWMVPS